MVTQIFLRRVLIQSRQIVNINEVPHQIPRHLLKRLHLILLRLVCQWFDLFTLNQLAYHFVACQQLACKVIVLAHCKSRAFMMETHECYCKLSSEFFQWK